MESQLSSQAQLHDSMKKDLDQSCARVSIYWGAQINSTHVLLLNILLAMS